MENAEDLLNLARAARGRGDIPAAAAAYRCAAGTFPADKQTVLQAAQELLRDCNLPGDAARVLEAAAERMPSSPAVFQLLAAACFASGAPEDAVRALRSLTALAPDRPSVWIDLGTTYAHLGRWPDAEAAYSSALRLAPTDVTALLGWGDALYSLGRPQDAAAAYRRAGETLPTSIAALFKLGSLLMNTGSLEEARGVLQRAVALDPTHAAAQVNLSLVLLRESDPEAATAAGRAAVAAAPGMAEAHHALGSALFDAGARDEARAHLRRAAEINPRAIPFLLALGRAEKALGHGEAAADALARVMALDPGNTQARTLLAAADNSSNDGGALLALAMAADKNGAFDEARANYETVLDRNPLEVFVLSRLLTIDGIEGRLDAAEDHHRALVTRLGQVDLRVQHWNHLAFIAYQSVLRPLPAALNRAVRRAIDRQVTAEIRTQSIVRPAPSAARVAGAGRRLRIGYLSSFFRDHPVGHVTAALFAGHDRKRFDVHAFYLPAGDPTPYTRQIKDGVEHFWNLSGTDSEMATTIAAQSLDILVYLDGYMTSSLLPVLALRPASIQVFWLGHAGSCDLTAIDYLIADATVVPPGEEALYPARVVRLPDVYHCASPHPIAGAMDRAEAGLPADGFVFCAFNNPEKIDRATFESWMRILRRIDGSVLWLSRTLSPAIADNLRAAAAATGVAGDRLLFATRVPDKAVHLARHRLCGLFLDTATLNASTTALDALWAGLPVLTINGPRFSSRIASSLLRAIGMDDMICASSADFEDRAVYLATHPQACGDVRRRLAANRETRPLFNIGAFCRNLENCFAAIVQNHLS